MPPSEDNGLLVDDHEDFCVGDLITVTENSDIDEAPVGGAILSHDGNGNLLVVIDSVENPDAVVVEEENVELGWSPT